MRNLNLSNAKPATLWGVLVQPFSRVESYLFSIRSWRKSSLQWTEWYISKMDDKINYWERQLILSTKAQHNKTFCKHVSYLLKLRKKFTVFCTVGDKVIIMWSFWIWRVVSWKQFILSETWKQQQIAITLSNYKDERNPKHCQLFKQLLEPVASCRWCRVT